MHLDVHCSIIHGGQDVETTKVSFDGGLDREDEVHIIHNGILLSHNKRWCVAISWMDLENIMPSKISQAEKLGTNWFQSCGI